MYYFNDNEKSVGHYDPNGASVKKKITKADKLKSFGCIIAGDEEWKTKKLIWKNFKDGKQEFFSFDNLEDFIKKKIEA